MPDLESLAQQIRRCRRCSLWTTRKEAVPGEGPETARGMLIGESPGREEDRLGRPFVGRSGKFLNETLESVGLRREDFFITGSVKCHPPKNRDPRSEELAACRPFLEKQIELIGPKVIVLLGRIALKVFLPGARLDEVRGKVLSWPKYKVMATYHPAAAMRFPARRRPFLEDMRTLSSLMEED